MSGHESQFSHDLSSAKYYQPDLVEGAPQAVPQFDPFAKPAATPCKLHQTMRWVTPLVLAMFVGAAGGLAWQHRQEIADSFTGARSKASNPLDLVLWLGGSKHSTKDVFSEIQRQVSTPAPLPTSSPFTSKFQNVDWSKGWNTQGYYSPSGTR